MEKISIHGALAELKLIDSKIDKRIEKIDPVGMYQLGRKVNNLTVIDEFEASAKANLQSVTDLIERRGRIKSAIVKANAVTLVKVGDKEMSIADAINYKASIVFKRKLINRLEAAHRGIAAKANVENEKVKTNADSLQQAGVSKEGATIEVAAITDLRNSYVKANEIHLCDPLEVSKAIEKMESELEEFETKIDYTLSEVNAITKIEV